LGLVLEVVGRNAGYTAAELQKYETDVKGMGITTMAARQSLVQMAQAHIDLARGADLARLAQDAAVIAGLDSSQAFETLITVIQRGSPVMARTLGLSVDFMGSYERLADQLGITTLELTADQKMQARLNEVMAQGVTIAGTYDAAMEAAGKQMRSINRHWVEARAALGEMFLPYLSKAVVGITDLLKTFNSLEPAQKRAVAGFLGVGTALTGVASAAILVTPKLITLFQSLGPLVTLASDSAFAVKLLAAGSNTAGLGLAGLLGPLVAATAGFVAFYVACDLAAKAAEVHIVTAEELQTTNVELSDSMATLQAASMNMDGTIGTLTATTVNAAETTIDYAAGMTNLLHETYRLNAGQRMAAAGMDKMAIAEQALAEMEQALIEKEEQRQQGLDLLIGSLANSTEVERVLALQMGETTLLAQTQEEAMSLLAWAYDTGTLSEEAYIAAGLEVLAVNEDSIPGYEAVQEAVENATGGMYGLTASTDAIPGSMRGVVTAAEEASASAEKMAEAQQKAWASFASSVQSAVASALDAYRSGNEEMLAEQQHALAEMLWNQTDTMVGMGQITVDESRGMKAAIAEEFGVMVSDTELATDALLSMYGDWATGGETSADEIVGFIQNIGEETETLVGEEEERIQTMIDQWQTMQEGVGTESETIASHYAKMGDEFGALAGETESDATLVMGSMDDVTVSAGLMADGAVESFDGVAASSGTMASEIVSSTSIAMGSITELTGAIEAIPDFKKITIDVEIIGDEAALPGSPQLLYYYMYEDLLQFIRDNPLELKALFDIGGALGGFGATAGERLTDPLSAALKAVRKQRVEHEGQYKRLMKVDVAKLRERDLKLAEQYSRLQFAERKAAAEGRTEEAKLLAWRAGLAWQEANAAHQQRLEAERGFTLARTHHEKMVELREEELKIQRELEEAQRRTLALERQREDLAFLEEQAKLLDLIREHGLDAQAIMGGIEMGIDADVGAIVQAMTAAMQAIVEQAEAELQISSSSKVFARIGTQMMAGLAESIASMTPIIQSQIQMAVQPLALPGRSASPVTTSNEYHYHLTTPSVMRDGGLQMEFQAMEMATR
jgi:microcompartment protein CcmL/EutN